jgi:hypothetical protein
MTTHTCDQCKTTRNEPLDFGVKGFKPVSTGGILLPEPHWQFDFCSHACLVKWMREAVKGEPVT